MVGALAVVGVVLAASAMSVYGDGANYLLSTISSGDAFGMPARSHMNELRDLPVILALRGGTTDVHLLAVTQSASYVGIGVCAFIAALLVSRDSRRRFVVVAVTAAVVVGMMGSYPSSEVLGGLALVVFVSASLARDQTWGIGLVATTVAASWVLIATHEAVSLCSLGLAVQALLRLHARGSFKKGTRVDVVGTFAVALLSAAAVAWSTYRIIVDQTGSHGFFFSLMSLWPSSAILMSVGAIALIALATWPKLLTQPVVRVVLMTSSVCLISIGSAIAIRLGPGAGYQSRAWCVALVLVSQVMLVVIWKSESSSQPGRQQPLEIPASITWLVATITLVALIVPLVNARLWEAGVTEIRSVIAAKSGLLLPSSVLSDTGQRATFSWTNPMLSVLLRGSTGDGVLVDPNGPEAGGEAWAPFPARQAHDLLPPQFAWRSG